MQGVLHCSDIECQMEFPIIDGIPIIVPNVRSYITDNLYHITAREDLFGSMDSLLGDGVGPNTLFDATRQHLSSYCWEHYKDIGSKYIDSIELGDKIDRTENSLLNCLNLSLNHLERSTYATAIDIGCSVGRTSFELADRCEGLVLGVDINFSMLRLAQSILYTGKMRYPLRRVGIVYDYITQNNITFESNERVDFWCCDALNLPFENSRFELASNWHVLDAVNSPFALLQNLHYVLKPEAESIIASPFDWSTTATPLEAWIGGHSQRSENKGSSELALKNILSSDKASKFYTGLALKKEITKEPWNIRIHDRHTATYKTDIFISKAEKIGLTRDQVSKI